MTPFKICRRCGRELPRCEFKLRKDGTNAAYCNPCASDYQKAYSAKHSAKKTAMACAWNRDNPDRRKEIANAWAKRNYDPSRIDKAAALRRYRAWRGANLERAHANEKRYRRRYPERLQYARGLRRGRTRLPKWFGEFDKLVLSEAHLLARLRTKLFGMAWHVDHIVPLGGKLVSGLHCASNIAVIPAAVNFRKSNKVWPDMPGAVA